MAKKWNYLTITLNRNNSGVPFVQAALPVGAANLTQGHDAIDALNELGENGWELVTSIGYPGDGRPQLIFKKES